MKKLLSILAIITMFYFTSCKKVEPILKECESQHYGYLEITNNTVNPVQIALITDGFSSNPELFVNYTINPFETSATIKMSATRSGTITGYWRYTVNVAGPWYAFNAVITDCNTTNKTIGTTVTK